MRNETPLTVVGTLVKNDGGRRVGEDQALVLNLRVAANERRFDRTTGTWVDGEKLYLSVNCWRALAESAASLAVGDPVIATGKLRTREWTNEQGERRSATDLEASAIGPDLARCTVTGVRRPRREQRSAEPAGPETADDADDLARADEPDRANDSSSSELAEGARPLASTGV